MKENKKGFTLLELLVVVLIIGILAAIALPQYRKAVAKAELTQIISRVKAISNAQDRYYLVNGTYATDMKCLDIDLDNRMTCSVSLKNWVTCYNNHFRISHYYADSTIKHRTECITIDKILITACEDFLDVESRTASNSMCSELGEGDTCYMAAKVFPI